MGSGGRKKKIVIKKFTGGLKSYLWAFFYILTSS